MSGWRDRAQCRGMDPALFVPDPTDTDPVIPPEAAEACAACPVAVECAAWAKRAGERGIIAAGRYTGQRHRERKQAVCGTDGGYSAHMRRGEKPCRACLDAHAYAQKERYYNNMSVTVRRARERVQARNQKAA